MSRLDKFVDHVRDPQTKTWVCDSACWEVDTVYGFDIVELSINLAQAILTEPIEKVLCLDLVLWFITHIVEITTALQEN